MTAETTNRFEIDVKRLIDVLDDVIATELVRYVRYRQHAMWAGELGGDPDFNPATMRERSHTPYVTVDDVDLKDLLGI